MYFPFIKEEDKTKIGSLIHYHRTHFFKHISQNNFLKDQDGEDICTRQTLSKIEKGNIIKNDSIYEEFLNKLNLKYNFEYTVNDIIPDSTFSTLLEACDYYDLKQLISISASCSKALEPYKNYVFFHEYHQCFCWIQTYYTTFQLPTLTEAEYIIYLKDMIDLRLYEVMIDLAFKTRILNGNYDFSYFDFKNASSMINRGNYMMTLYNQSKFTDMIEYCNELEKKYIDKNNFIRLLDIYSLKGLAFSNVEKDKFDDLINQINQILEQNKPRIPAIKISQLYKNLGLQAFRLDIYDKAIDYFELFVKENPPYGSIISIDLCISYQKQNMIDKLKSFVQAKNMYKGDSQYEELLNYFILKYKYNVDSNQLSYFIVENVPTIIDETMGKFKNFFYEELNSLVEQTKHYKDLKDYLDATNFVLPI